MRVVGVQLDIGFEQPLWCLEQLVAGIEAAARDGAQLIVLPEMSTTGFSMNLDLHRHWYEKACEVLQATAQRLQVDVLAGLGWAPASGDGLGTNRAVLWQADGREVGYYEKIHPFSYGDEARFIRGGERLITCTSHGLRLAPFICYDLRFPEVFRAVAGDVSLMVVMASWPSARRHAWRSLLVARAIENQCYVLGVNRVGTANGLDYAGDSLFIDPLGEILSDGGSVEARVGGEVSQETVQAVRARFPFLADRRPALYAQLADGGVTHLP